MASSGLLTGSCRRKRRHRPEGARKRLKMPSGYATWRHPLAHLPTIPEGFTPGSLPLTAVPQLPVELGTSARSLVRLYVSHLLAQTLQEVVWPASASKSTEAGDEYCVSFELPNAEHTTAELRQYCHALLRCMRARLSDWPIPYHVHGHELRVRSGELHTVTVEDRLLVTITMRCRVLRRDWHTSLRRAWWVYQNNPVAMREWARKWETTTDRLSKYLRSLSTP
jgi:hypothetical protein